MAIGRSRYAPPVSTKGHSVLKTRSYGLSSRAPPTSYVTPRSSAHSTRGEEYLLADRVSNVNYLSNALLDEGYDTALRSRGRDQALLKEATNAIPRGSVRDTTALTSSLPSLGGARRFPRRFGKTGVVRKTAKSPTSLYSNTSLSREEGQSLSTSDLMASAGPQPNRSWQRFGSARSTSAARSYLEDDDEDAASPGASAYTSRASSVGPLSLSGSSGTHLASQLPLSLSRTRRALSTLPVSSSGSGLSESHLLDRMTSKPWGQSASRHLGSSSSLSSPTHRPEYESPFHEYEADVSPAHSPSYYPSSPIAPRRRQKVLSTSRRPAGNYYERLLRKRGKQHGRFGPYYDLESIEGSDLSGVLSDRESLDGGTYDNDNDDYESSSVSPSRQYLSSAVSPYDPYFVDQDTEFVPFKPSRPLLTKGLLEITPLGHEDSEGSNSHSLPSPTTDLSLSRYLPSSLISAATSSMSDSTLSPRLPYRSIVPYTFSPSSSPPPASSLPSPSDASLAVVPSSSFSSPTPNQQLLETLVSNAVTRARNAINDLAIPEYSGASLLLSVEGAGTSPDGKRVDFTYTPPPIPLYGRSVVLNDRLLGIKPAQTIKPLDNFIAGYIERMSALRAALTQRVDKDREKRVHYGLKPLDTGPFSSGTSSTYTPYTSSYTPRSTSSYRSYTPSYTQSHDYVPVKHLSSQKLEHLPVTSFRKRQDDGQTERVDVFSLGEFRPRLSSSTAKAITIPESATGGYQLSVLDKINIKAAIIASKLEPDPIKRRRPRSEYAASKYREMRREKLESPTGGSAVSGGSERRRR